MIFHPHFLFFFSPVTQFFEGVLHSLLRNFVGHPVFGGDFHILCITPIRNARSR